ncbi:MAG: hypothetical protein ACHP6H_06930 [Legionellales bacterium]
MRKYLFLLPLVLCACGHASNTQKLQAEIDSLHKELGNAYKPGFGEFMSGIQVHHAKLWFAGNAQNWALADFELKEIREALDGIKAYDTARPETKSIGMIDDAMDSMDNAVKSKDLATFKKSYTLLTNTCNDCHHATKHEFNVVKIPDNPPFTNQEFKGQ